ncbi:type IV pilin protein [Hydrogenophaga sp. A37]|uniref:type IV pilin protein n=1 Tax=Hydrogenophaga sp. A37 TaxID=1945864 RepID=UPI0034441508
MASSAARCAPSGQGKHQGFTLIELMITVAVIAILTALALPSYQDYVLRGRLVDATTALSSLRARMEQYYQDNRTYQSVGTFVSPCANSSTAGTFTVSCPTLGNASYVLQATGAGTTAGFVFTMNNNGTQATTGLPAAWGTVPEGGYACWIGKKGGTC